jgi:succinyl-CoA synthetase alpha subunit
MGHAGAIISGGEGTAQEKIKALEAVGAKVARLPTDIAQLVKDILG